MPERRPPLTSPYPPSPAKEERVSRQLHSLAAQAEVYTQKENEWLEAYHIRADATPDGPTLEEETHRFVFHELTRLTAAKLDITFRHLTSSVEGPSLFLPTPGNPSRSTTLVRHQLQAKRSGTSLEELLEHSKALARQEPAAVYGYMLLSSFQPLEIESPVEESINFLAITPYTVEEVREVIKRAQFPAHLNDTLRELSGAYQQALREVTKGFFEPSSPHFPAISELYHAAVTNGTPMQTELFLAQVLGMNTTEQGRHAYGRLGELIREGNHSTIHEECLAIIEDSFEGLLGEEAYKLFGIEQQPQSEIDDGRFSEAQRKKQQLLKAVKNTQGTIALPDSRYGQFELTAPELYYQKNGAQTYIQLFADAMTDEGDSVPVDFQLSGKHAYSWNFLRSHKEAPELFNAMTEAVDEALEAATSQATHTRTPAHAPAAPAKKHYPRDEIYELRKQHRKEHQQNEELATQTGQISELAHTADTHPAHRFEVVFPEDYASSLDPELRISAEIAIAKYGEGLRNCKFLRYQSLGGEKTYRLRHGDVRVLAVLENDTLVVTQVGPRSVIYS